ncbi:MAG: SLBB domain-containing protein [Gemmatimonadales bacterium]
MRVRLRPFRTAVRRSFSAVLYAGVTIAFLGPLVDAAPLAAQQLTPQQMEQLRRNPDLVRQRIQQSGLTPDQIRSQLRAAGYSPTLLDQFMTADSLAVLGGVSEEAVQALAMLGISQMEAQGLEAVPLQTGVDSLKILADSAKIDSLAAVEELQVFGLDVFGGRTTRFQPVLSGPVPPNYHVGPGDVMVLVITGDVELVRELEVTREGFIVIPQVGQIAVANLTMEQLRALLRQRLGQSYSGIQAGTTRFDITVARLHTNQIFVIGEVAQPGAYQLASVATVLNALYAAGGPTERASFRNITVRRRGDTVAVFDLYDYLLAGDTHKDVILEQGDVVFVPVHGIRASISGAVLRPAIYDLKEGETLDDLVQAAGGFDATAALRRISISRIVAPNLRRPGGADRIVVDVPIDQIEAGHAPLFPIESGDSVTVFEVPEAIRSTVELIGNVYHPGTYGWRPGLRLSDLIELAGGFQSAVYAGRAHIERLNAADSTRYLVEVALPADSSQPYPNDVLLQDYDIVTVYGRAELRQPRTVSIAGMVNQPGRFPFRGGMTLRDLVLMARGLRDGAWLDSVEIARLPADRTGGTLAIHRRVPMDSTYIFEPESSTYPRLPGLAAKGSGAPEIPLEPYDQVTVFRQPQFELQRTVKILGEVLFPGTYALTRKDEKVSDLLQRAGGLLNTAYAGGARFFRSLDTTGQINLDLEEILRHPSNGHDIELQPGDSLFIPEYIPTIRVMGAVNAPISVLYQEGAGLDYYIANAGGFARLADKGNVSVRYANGSAKLKNKFLFFRSTPKPGPGSTVFVPAKDPSDKVDFVALFGSVAQILAAAVTVIVVATR